jgi:hypothetical protein
LHEELDDIFESPLQPIDLGVVHGEWNMVQIHQNLQRRGGPLATLSFKSFVEKENAMREAGLLRIPPKRA